MDASSASKPKATKRFARKPDRKPILVVEDDLAVRDMTQAALERQGYRVFSATCGPEALALFAEHRDEIDLVVTDIVMPRMSGPQLIERLRLDDRDMAALFMSGAAEDRVRNVLTDDGCFLQKPFTPTTLSAKVREILDRHPRGHATS